MEHHGHPACDVAGVAPEVRQVTMPRLAGWPIRAPLAGRLAWRFTESTAPLDNLKARCARIIQADVGIVTPGGYAERSRLSGWNKKACLFRPAAT